MGIFGKGLFRNSSSMANATANAVASRRGLAGIQSAMSSMGMAGNTTNQPQTGMFGSMINTARIAAAARGGQGTVPGSPGGMFRSIMQGRNATNQNQLASTPINPSAFNTGTVGQVFNQNYVDPVLTQKKSSPMKQTMDSSVDPLTGQYIDPTMSQGLDPGTVDPMLDQEDTSLTQY